MKYNALTLQEIHVPGVKGRSGGHNRKPLHLHVVEGTLRSNRHGPTKVIKQALKDVTPANQLIPDPPATLDEHGQRHWRALSDAWRRRGLWDGELYPALLEAHCLAYQRMVASSDPKWIDSFLKTSRELPLSFANRDRAMTSKAYEDGANTTVDAFRETDARHR